jgi:ATP/maltotriose-dependent transcriptional regulator MalT
MARAAVSEFAPLAALPEATPLQRCTWLSAASYSSLLDGEFAAWGRSWRKAGEIAAEGGLHFLASMCQLQYIWQPLVEGDLAHAESCLRPLVPRPDDKPMLVSFYHFQCAWLALLQNEPALALQHSEKFTIISAPIAKTVRKVVTLNVHAHALAACGQTERALRVAKEAVDWFPQPGQGMVQFVSLMTQADILRQAGERAAFLAVMAEAFATGRRGGVFITIPWLPKMVARLAEAALAAGIEVEYVLELVRQRKLFAVSTP